MISSGAGVLERVEALLAITLLRLAELRPRASVVGELARVGPVFSHRGQEVRQVIELVGGGGPPLQLPVAMLDDHERGQLGSGRRDLGRAGGSAGQQHGLHAPGERGLEGSLGAQPTVVVQAQEHRGRR